MNFLGRKLCADKIWSELKKFVVVFFFYYNSLLASCFISFAGSFKEIFVKIVDWLLEGMSGEGGSFHFKMFFNWNELLEEHSVEWLMQKWVFTNFSFACL